MNNNKRETHVEITQRRLEDAIEEARKHDPYDKEQKRKVDEARNAFLVAQSIENLQNGK